jgi:Protein of unknown function (Hypoth_ymh)
VTEETPAGVPEYPDHHDHLISWLTKDGLTHFLNAAAHYDGLLEKSWKKVQTDETLFNLIDENQRNKLPIAVERERLDWLKKWLRDLLGQAGQFGDVHMVRMSHGTARYIKSLCALYENALWQRRNRLAADPEVPKSMIESIDVRLAELSEKSKIGVFGQATPAPLLMSAPSAVPVDRVAQDPPDQGAGPPAERDAARGLRIIDGQLRERCGDLFSIFTEKNLEERYDTVIRETGALVEDRLRAACQAPTSTIGVDLASYAFGGEKPRLVLSSEKAEQEGVHLLFRGFFLWIRNPAGHRLLGKISKERVQQLLAFADYLLGLVGEGSAQEIRTS